MESEKEFGFDIAVYYLGEKAGQPLSRDIVEKLAPIFDFMISPHQIVCKTWGQTIQILHHFGIEVPRVLTEEQAVRIHHIGRHYKCLSHQTYKEDCKPCKKLLYSINHSSETLYAPEPSKDEILQWGRDRNSNPGLERQYISAEVYINIYYHQLFNPYGHRYTIYLEHWPICIPKEKVKTLGV
jgi:hypothetical protein